MTSKTSKTPRRKSHPVAVVIFMLMCVGMGYLAIDGISVYADTTPQARENRLKQAQATAEMGRHILFNSVRGSLIKDYPEMRFSRYFDRGNYIIEIEEGYLMRILANKGAFRVRLDVVVLANGLYTVDTVSIVPLGSPT